MSPLTRRIALVFLIVASVLGACLILAKSPGAPDADTPASYGH